MACRHQPVWRHVQTQAPSFPLQLSSACSQCLKLNPALLPTPNLLLLHLLTLGAAPMLCVTLPGDLVPLQPLCSLSLHLISRKVLLMSSSTETSPLSPIPHVTPGYCYNLLTAVLPHVCQPSTSVFSVWPPHHQHQHHLGTC